MDATQRDGAPYDVVIIGGGICGAASARALTRRGYRILLLDRADFASGSTAAGTRLVQGGLQYLESGRARQLHESLHAREAPAAQPAAPGASAAVPVARLPRRAPRAALVRAGLTVYDVFTPRKVAPWSRTFRCGPSSGWSRPWRPRGCGRPSASTTGWWSCPSGLCLEYLAEAREGGADLRNYASVDFILAARAAAAPAASTITTS